MSEPYIRVSDQEEDWKPVIKNFISECALQGLIEIKKVRPLLAQRPIWDDEVGAWAIQKTYSYRQETRIVLGEEAHRLGYSDVKALFNNWFNKSDIFFNPYKKNESGPYDEPYYDPASDIV